MAALGNTFQKITITGIILPDKDNENNEEVDIFEDDTVENDDFLGNAENDAVFAGALHVRSQRCPYKEVIIKDERTQEKYRIKGHFLVSDPWWKITATIKREPGQTRNRWPWSLCHSPKYYLQSDHTLAQATYKLFLTRCGVDDAEYQNRSDFIRLVNGGGTNFNLDDIVRVATDLYNAEDEEHAKANVIATRIVKSDCGQMVILAQEFPTIFEFLPILLPNHVCKLLTKEKTTDPDDRDDGKHMRVIQQLNTVVSNAPWKFAFRQAIFEECNIFLGEATKDRFVEAGLYNIEHMEITFQYAIHIYNALRTRCNKDGHTHQEEKVLRREFNEHLGRPRGRPVQAKEWEKIKEILEESKAIKYLEVRKTGKMFLYDLWLKETAIAKGLGELLSHGQQKVDDLALNLSQSKLDKSQQDAAKSIQENPLTIVSGKGGTGKTTVVLKVVANVPRERVALTAPTGKAAANLKKISKGAHEAITLHQLTASYYQWKRKRRQKEAMDEGFMDESHYSQRNKEADKWKYSTTEIWVVDECSLVPIGIFADALNLLQTHSNLKRVVLLGDHRQLPSVQPGNLLEDLVTYFKSRGSSKYFKELRTCHRASSKLIYDNSTKIQARGFDGWPTIDPDKGFELIEWNIDNNTYETSISQWVAQLPCDTDDIADHRKSQFIAHRKRDCDKINRWCCSKYSKHELEVNDQHSYRARFEKGDKISASRNAYIRSIDSSDEEDKRRIQNGEIWFIKDIVDARGTRGQDETRVTLENAEGESEFTAYMVDLRRDAKICHAWAQTIHKFQGSEEETIIFVMGTGSKYQDWKLVYTAVTRAKKHVTIIGTRANLHKAIEEKPKKRNTGLQDHLVGVRSKRRASLAFSNDHSMSAGCSGTSTSPNKKPRM